MRRLIIIGLWARVQVMKTLIWRHPIEQRIYHGINIIQSLPLLAQILAQNFQLRRILPLS